MPPLVSPQHHETSWSSFIYLFTQAIKFWLMIFCRWMRQDKLHDCIANFLFCQNNIFFNTRPHAVIISPFQYQLLLYCSSNFSQTSWVLKSQFFYKAKSRWPCHTILHSIEFAIYHPLEFGINNYYEFMIDYSDTINYCNIIVN